MSRRSARIPARVAVSLAAVTAVAYVHAALPPVRLTEVATGLAAPVEIVNANDASSRLFILEQKGRIRVMRDGKVLERPFIDVTAKVASGGERGLLGLAFDPHFNANGAFYVYYTAAHTGAVTIERYLRDRGDPDRGDPATGAVLLSIPHDEYANHNGGHLAFGPDGYLYAGTGDGGPGNDRLRNGQDTGSLLGKLLRIAVDGGPRYRIPDDNPFAKDTCAKGRCPEVLHYGLRNPWRYSFDRATGDLYIADVGQDDWEEVDYLPARTPGPRNFGWGIFEGFACFNDTYHGKPGACDALRDAVKPILAYGHRRDGGIAIIGGYVYRGKRIAALQGYYLYGDYGSRRIWAARREGAHWRTDLLLPPGPELGAISSFGEDEAGELYVTDLGHGKIWRIDPR